MFHVKPDLNRASGAFPISEDRDLAHEADMRALRREQLAADCGGEMADDADDEDLEGDLQASYDASLEAEEYDYV